MTHCRSKGRSPVSDEKVPEGPFHQRPGCGQILGRLRIARRRRRRTRVARRRRGSLPVVGGARQGLRRGGAGDERHGQRRVLWSSDEQLLPGSLRNYSGSEKKNHDEATNKLRNGAGIALPQRPSVQARRRGRGYTPRRTKQPNRKPCAARRRRWRSSRRC